LTDAFDSPEAFGSPGSPLNATPTQCSLKFNWIPSVFLEPENDLYFGERKFKVGKAKTASSEGRIVPLNQAALGAFQS